MSELKKVFDVDALRASTQAARSAGKTIGFVPTMGNLHAGHISLVAEARQHADFVVVSIFVNPTQFGEGEDFDHYPRTVEEDCAQLQHAGADLVFLPSVSVMYPRGPAQETTVSVSGISTILCGAHRPGHFDGVTTVVSKLFHMVQPDIAVFGEKDYQQLAIIRRMVADLNFPIEIRGIPPIREADGLAMSSRNRFLSPDERNSAAKLQAELLNVAEQLKSGERDYARLQHEAIIFLKKQGFRPQYLEIRRPDLSLPTAADSAWVILVAAGLGSTRLIDNIAISMDGG